MQLRERLKTFWRNMSIEFLALWFALMISSRSGSATSCCARCNLSRHQILGEKSGAPQLVEDIAERILNMLEPIACRKTDLPQRTLSLAEAQELLNRYGGEAAWIRHCRAVAAVAGEVGRQLEQRIPLDREYLQVGALLHDIGRSRTHHPVGHGVEGYRLLTELGHPWEAHVCASHLFCGLSREDAAAHGLPDRDFLPRTLEEQLVPLVDSVVELDRPTTLENRVASIMRRYEGQGWFLKRMELARHRAGLLLAELSRDYGICLERIAWKVLGNSTTPL